MRQESAASAKGSVAHCQLVPREGTKLRVLYDRFMTNKGLPIEMNFSEEAGRTCRRYLHDLRDYYGLDIRCLKRRGGNRCGKTPNPSEWVLAGEWFGRTYVDYIAERLAKHDREARQ